MNMSFMLTTKQMRAASKFETRRLRWLKAKVGDVVQPIVKGQGLKKGEKVQTIGPRIRFTVVRREPLNKIRKPGCIAEGFPGMSPREFVEMFCRHNKCMPNTLVTVIRFERVEEVSGRG